MSADLSRNQTLASSLPAVAQLALVYAPKAAHEPTLALLALDARLANLIRRSSEPMLAQLRLAWWRESISRDPAEWPEGEPILAAMRSWEANHAALAVLVDAWEALTAPPPLTGAQLSDFAAGRGAAAGALAVTLGLPGEQAAASELGRIWGIEDLAMRLGAHAEKAVALELAASAPARLPRVSRPLRPLRVLAGLTRRRRIAGSEQGAASPGAMLQALKLGLLGL